MPIITSPFKVPFYLRNAHVQTMLPSTTRNQIIPKRKQSFLQTNDGDVILLEAVQPNSLPNKQSDQAVLLIHGLTGSADSQYIVGLQNLLKDMGVFSVAMNFRGAKTPNNLARGYHSGSSNDIAEIVNHLQKIYANYQWHAIGFSLGGNVLLKYLGENPDNSLTSAIAVSVPFSLDICATRMDQGFSKVYRNHLLSELNNYLALKHEHLKKQNPEQAKLLSERPIDKKFSSFWDFDHEIIAPIHGFDSAKDYYQRCSSKQFLKLIETPTHILNAIDDPFLSPKLIPKENDLSKSVTLELSKHGGHVGFFSGRNNYYVEKLVNNAISSLK
jgi:predicted alpha/beta-fold hydrolase